MTRPLTGGDLDTPEAVDLFAELLRAGLRDGRRLGEADDL